MCTLAIRWREKSNWEIWVLCINYQDFFGYREYSDFSESSD